MSNVAVQQVIQTEEQRKHAEQVAELKAQLAAMGERTTSVSFKIVEFKDKKTGEDKRGINIHGVCAKPMFVYGSQALVLAEIANELQKFVEANRGNLTWKK